MFAARSQQIEREGEIVLISSDQSFVDAVKGVFGSNGRLKIRLGRHVSDESIDLSAARIVIADIDARNRDDLVALQQMMARLSGSAPVVVVTEAFDKAVARWLLQIRVADFLLKPVDPVELAGCCVKAMQAEAITGSSKEAQILSFLPAAGGVGVTTLAIQTTLTLLAGKQKISACLVDLDFQNGSCAFHLDVEPRLDLDAIGPNPQRLDAQLLEVMLSPHPSGMLLLASPNRPVDSRLPDPAVVMKLLDLAASRFDYVVIDLPRTWFAWNDAVMSGSNKVFVVTETTVPGLKLASNLAQGLVTKFGGEMKPRVIVNRFEQKMFGPGLKRADLEATLKDLFAGTVSNNYKLVREAIDRGVPLDAVQSGSNVAIDLRKVIVSEIEAK
ncbi:MAG: CpaE family protein [Beijerinckiaceae bacterium]